MNRALPVTLLFLLTVVLAPTLVCQPTGSRSWIVRVEQPIEPRQVIELLASLLPEEAAISSVQPLVPFTTAPRTASDASAALGRYHVVHLTTSAVILRNPVPGVEIYPNHRYRVDRHDDEEHIDPFIDEQWGLDAIRIDEAWHRTTGSASVIIGILDTGIELDHPDLEPNLYVNPAEDINGNGRFDAWSSSTVVENVSGDLDGVDQDGNGYVDDVCGFDFVDQVTPNLGDWSGRDGLARDEQGHGTLVSGVAAARGGNSRGIAGVAPKCSILPLRAFDATGDGEDDDIAAAIIYAADNGVDILNMSFGDLYRSPLLADAVRYASERGVLLVASSGNNGISDPHYPSGFPEVMSVGALRPDTLLSFFSAFGSGMSLVAPGEDILTTATDRGYRVVSGTSFAAPHVSGVAALYRSLFPDRDAGELRFALESGARDLGSSGWDIDFGSGLLDAPATLSDAGGGRVSIDHPRSDSGLAGAEVVPVIGSAVGVGLKSWTVEYGQGETPEEWVGIGSGTGGVLSGVLGELDPMSVPEGVVTLSLRIERTDGSTLERRSRLYVDRSPPVITDISTSPIWIGQEKGLLVQCRTDDLSIAQLDVTTEGDTLVVAPEEGKTGLTRTHYWIIRPHEFESGSDRDLRIRTRNPAGLTTIVDLGTTSFPDGGPPSNTFVRSDISVPYGYYLPPDTTHDDASRYLLLNRFENLTFSGTVLYERVGTDSRPIDSLGNWVPRGIGDTDGDGLLEALLQATGTGIITEQSVAGGSLFASTVFTDTAGGQFYPGAFIDVDRDGVDEIVGHAYDPASDADLLTVWRRNGAELVTLTQGRNRTGFPPTAKRNSFGASDIRTGDVDADGFPEILLGDADGDVMLFSWVPGEGLVERWRFETDGIDADKIIAIGDFTADGRDDIAFGWQPQSGLSDSNEYPVPVWSLRGIEFDGGWKPRTLFDEHFAWPRPVGTFRSGLAAGDVGFGAGDELSVVLFPDAWVFTFDMVGQSLRSVWSRSGAMINEPAVLSDQFGVGGPSVAIGDGLEIALFTVDSSVVPGPLPPRFYGWSLNDSTAFLGWHPVEGDVVYRLYREDPDGTQGEFLLIEETDSLHFLDTGAGLDDDRLEAGKAYRYLVVAVDDSGDVSGSSNLVTVRPHSPTVPLRAIPIAPDLVSVHFSRRLSDRMYRTGSLEITDETGSAVPLSTVIAGGDSTLVVTLDRPYPGRALSVRSTSLLRDATGSPSDTGVVLTVRMPEGEEEPEFWITAARPLPGNRIELLFSASVDPASVDPDNFLINPEVSAADASVDPGNDRIIILTLPPDYRLGPFGFTYTVEVRSLSSSSGEEIPDGPGSIAGFTLTAESLDMLEAHPQPFSVSLDEQLTFVGLPEDGLIEIYTVSGKIIRILDIDRGDGATVWDGRDNGGEAPAPGVYLYRVVWTGPNGEEIATELEKFSIVP